MKLQEQKHYYGFAGLPNHWVDDKDRQYPDEFFDDKTYEDLNFDNFSDMDKMFGHENSLFGTRGLPVGHPKRTSKSFDQYNKTYGPMIVRVVKDNSLQEQVSRIKSLMSLISEEEQNDIQENILYPLSTGGDKTLILLPGAGKNGGQGSDDFNELAENLGSDFSIFTADFDNELDVRKYAKNIAKEIENNPNINSFAVGGFSIGGAMAWHLAKELKKLNSEKFINKLFFIDSGISNSTDEFIENILKINTPRIAIAQPLDIFIKNREGKDITKDEEKNIINFYNNNDLNSFKNRNDVRNN